MTGVRCFAAALVLSGASFGLPAVWAQAGPRASYQPSVPTLSTWFSLYQRNSGPLDNYHTFVRPERQLQDAMRQQSTAIQRQAEGIRGLTGQMSELRQGRSPAHPTGAGSIFMDYGHYYDLKTSAGPFRPSASRFPVRGAR